MAFSGPVYLTGPYDGAPYGLSIVVPAVAGPFNLGDVVTRAAIGVEMYSGRVVVTAAVPTIEGGVPLRLKTLSVTVNRPNFLFNPTNCGMLATESALTSSFAATQGLSTPFQVGECSKLPFKPSLSAFSGAKTSQARSARASKSRSRRGLTRRTSARSSCSSPSGFPRARRRCAKPAWPRPSKPGPRPAAARAPRASAARPSRTPVLPGTLSGPAYLVSHGGEAFPDLDLILSGRRRAGRAGRPHPHLEHRHHDLDVRNAPGRADLERRRRSAGRPAVGAERQRQPLQLDARRRRRRSIAQSGAKLTQQTTIAVRNCPFAIVAHRTVGKTGDRQGQGARRRPPRDQRSLPAGASAQGGSAGTYADRPSHAGRRAHCASITSLRVRLRVNFTPKSKSGHGRKPP